MENHSHAVEHEHSNSTSFAHKVVQTFRISGLHCTDCAATLEKSLSSQQGVLQASLNFATAKLYIEYMPQMLGENKIIGLIERMGYEVVTSPEEKHSKFVITGLDCPDCAEKLQRAIAAMPGVGQVHLNFSSATLNVTHSEATAALEKKIRALGYDVRDKDTHGKASSKLPWWLHNKKVVLTLISGVFWALGIVMGFVFPVLRLPLLLMAVVTGAFYPVRASIAVLRTGFTFDMNFLMSIAVVGALTLGEHVEAATVVFLFSLGNTLESYTMEKTRHSMRALMELAPQLALVLRDGEELTVPVEEVGIGETVIVKPGERIPIDGVVLKGFSSVNQAPITGESVPVEKNVGNAVFAGTLNEQGTMEIGVQKLVADSTLSKIIEMVEEAQAQRAPTQRFVDRFAQFYTPIVIALALGIAFIPPLLLRQGFGPWVYRGLALLLVSCPCALVISTPVSIVSAIGNAAKNGVLIKGGAYLEKAASITALALDKTGTVTYGKPEVTDIRPALGYTVDQVLILTAAVEARSEHAVAQAVLLAAQTRKLRWPQAEDFQALTGRGVTATVDGVRYYVSSPRFAAKELSIDIKPFQEDIDELQSQGKTVMIFAQDTRVCGLIAVADTIRPESHQLVANLHKAGIKRVVMLTGDNKVVAAATAAKLGFDDFRAELMPWEKVRAIEELLTENATVAMVGDGVNDAPALATASLGIAMGGAGTDTALETADIALMADDLSKLPFAIKLSRRTLGIIKQNIAFSLIVKAVAISLVVPNWLTLWLAIVADTGAALVVILNGMRLRTTK